MEKRRLRSHARWRGRSGWKMAAAMVCGLFLFSGVEAAELSIDEAVELAISQNTSLKMTAKGEETAKAALKSARGANSFDIGASGSLTDGKTSSARRQDNGSASLRASLPVYTGGRNEASIKSAEIGIDSAALVTERARENLRLAVIRAYYDVLEAEKTIKIEQDSVDRYQAHLTNVEQLFSAGSKARIDVLRSSVALTNARQTLIRAENDYEIKKLALKNLLKLDANEPLTLTEDFHFEPFFPRMDTCVSYAFAHRKDLLVDEYELAQRELDIKAAKAGYLPSVNVSASTGASERFYPSSNASQNYQLGLSASWTIFDSGVTEASVDRATTARDVAALSLADDREAVELAVRQAYYNMREARRRFIATKAAVSEAEEDYYIATEKYRAGQGILLDVIDAQVALATAQMNFNSAQYDYARYRATVENEVGLGLGETQRMIDPQRVDEIEEKIRARGGLPSEPPDSRDVKHAKEVIREKIPDYDERRAAVLAGLAAGEED